MDDGSGVESWEDDGGGDGGRRGNNYQNVLNTEQTDELSLRNENQEIPLSPETEINRDAPMEDSIK